MPESKNASQSLTRTRQTDTQDQVPPGPPQKGSWRGKSQTQSLGKGRGRGSWNGRGPSGGKGAKSGRSVRVIGTGDRDFEEDFLADDADDDVLEFDAETESNFLDEDFDPQAEAEQ